MFELLIAPEKLHLFQREVLFLNRVYWKNAVSAEYGERDNGLIPATLHVNFACIGEYQIVGWLHHKNDEMVVPLHIEQALGMVEHLRSRKCDLLGKRQSRNETWVLVDADGQMLCCGPAGANKHEVERFYLDVAATWLKQLNNVINRNWSMSANIIQLTDYLAAVHASIRQHGFVFKSMRHSDEAINDGLQPTYFHALTSVMSTPQSRPFDLDEPVHLDVNDNDRFIAGNAIEFIRSWNMDDDDNRRDEFKQLLFKAAAENVLQTGIEAAAAFAVIEYLQAQSCHTGTVGTWLELYLRPIARMELKKSYLHKMLDNMGNVLVWFSNTYGEWLKPGVYRVYIQKHDRYQGIAQTQVSVEAYDTDSSKWVIDISERDDDWRFIVKDKHGRWVASSSYWFPTEVVARKFAQERVDKGAMS